MTALFIGGLGQELENRVDILHQLVRVAFVQVLGREEGTTCIVHTTVACHGWTLGEEARRDVIQVLHVIVAEHVQVWVVVHLCIRLLPGVLVQ